MTDKVIYEKWENGVKIIEDYVPVLMPRWDNGEPVEVRFPKQSAQTPSGWQQIIITPKGEKKTVTSSQIFPNDTPLYPARQWNNLTDEEICAIKENYFNADFLNFARAIEKLSKVKNP